MPYNQLQKNVYGKVLGLCSENKKINLSEHEICELVSHVCVEEVGYMA